VIGFSAELLRESMEKAEYKVILSQEKIEELEKF